MTGALGKVAGGLLSGLNARWEGLKLEQFALIWKEEWMRNACAAENYVFYLKVRLYVSDQGSKSELGQIVP